MFGVSRIGAFAVAQSLIYSQAQTLSERFHLLQCSTMASIRSDYQAEIKETTQGFSCHQVTVILPSCLCACVCVYMCVCVGPFLNKLRNSVENDLLY